MRRAFLALLLVTLPAPAQTAAEFEALSRMGFLHYSRDQFNEARGYLEKAVAARPQSFPARFLLAATLVQLKDTENAIVQLRQALARNPGHRDARKLLAAQYVETRQFRDAITLLQPNVETPPYDEETHLLLIESRQSSGDSAAAFALARKAAARFPRSAQVLTWLGFQLQFAGRYEEAKGPLQQAIALDPDFPMPLHLLGEVFLKQEDYAEAAKWLARAAEKMPGDIEILLSMSRAQAESGDTAQALETLQRAPEDARVHLQLSRLYFRLGDEAKARRHAELSVQLRDRMPSAPSLTWRAAPPPPAK